MATDVDELSALPILDREAVDAIAAVDEELLTELVDCYRRDGREHVAAIAEAHGAGDVERMQRHAHAMKGASGTIGARRVQRLCARVQHATLDEASRWIAALEEAFEASARAAAAVAS